MMAKTGAKGLRAEEALRDYFLAQGYFVARGVQAQFESADVTDIDLWLYGRPSALSRERTNVDLKNRAAPKALERVIWALGLRDALGLERCIVATTDTRPLVRDFGNRNGVLVLDGAFLSHLVAARPRLPNRLTEEELTANLDDAALGSLGQSLRRRLQRAKAKLVSKLDFDGCNAWLEEIRDCMHGVLSDPSRAAPQIRVLYLVCAYFLIGMDYSAHRFVFLELKKRQSLIEEGIRFGEGGSTKFLEGTNLAIRLASAVSANPSQTGSQLRAEFDRQFSDIKADIIASYFAKLSIAHDSFGMALALEREAYSTNLRTPSQLGPELQGLIGMLCDFHGLDRKRVLI
jgi:hypothetical protein